MAEPVPLPDDRPRCAWAVSSLIDAAYHDDEWGVPVHDDRALFERLMLEGFQAGLSWTTILRKRDNFFRAFDGWVPERIAAYGPDDIARLLADAGIVRNRLKVNSAVQNARAFLALQQEMALDAAFDAYLAPYADPPGKPRPQGMGDVPATTAASDALSKDLRKRGFAFVGSTICYAFMQSVGLVDDHVVGCWRATPV